MKPADTPSEEACIVKIVGHHTNLTNSQIIDIMRGECKLIEHRFGLLGI